MKIRIEGIKHGSFAPKGGICYPKKKYLPMRNAILSTVLQGKVTLSKVCRHEFIGSYDIDRVNSSFCQNLKRDIISLKNIGVNTIKLVMVDRDKTMSYEIPLIYIDSTYGKVKNAILQYIHLNKLINNTL
jgi:hypothetical protein